MIPFILGASGVSEVTVGTVTRGLGLSRGGALGKSLIVTTSCLAQYRLGVGREKREVGQDPLKRGETLTGSERLCGYDHMRFDNHFAGRVK